MHLRRVCLGEVRAEVAIFATYIANYAKYSKLDSVFKEKNPNIPRRGDCRADGGAIRARHPHQTHDVAQTTQKGKSTEAN